MRIFAQLRRARRAVRSLGLTQAVIVYARYYALSGSSKQLVKIVPRPLSSPVYIRKGGSDWWVAEQIFYDEEYDSRHTSYNSALDRHYNKLIDERRTPVIIDCGANIGLSSIWFAHRFPKCTVIAIEPEIENYNLLIKNTDGYNNIIPINAAVSDRLSNYGLKNSNEHTESWAWSAEQKEDGTIRGTTIPDAISLVRDPSYFIVKIDIEGGEVALMRANTDWVSEVPLIVFESHDWAQIWGGTAHAILSVLCKAKRAYIWRAENTFAFSDLHLNKY